MSGMPYQIAFIAYETIIVTGSAHPVKQCELADRCVKGKTRTNQWLVPERVFGLHAPELKEECRSRRDPDIQQDRPIVAAPYEFLVAPPLLGVEFGRRLRLQVLCENGRVSGHIEVAHAVRRRP